MGRELIVRDERGHEMCLQVPAETDIVRVVQTVGQSSVGAIREMMSRGVPGQIKERITIYEEW